MTTCRLLDTAGLIVVVLGAGYLLLGPVVGRRVRFPDIQQKVEPDGRHTVNVNRAALHQAFVRAGLPDPPDLNGADPVPVEVLMHLARAWARDRDAVSVGRLGQVYQALEEHEAALGCFAAAAELDPDETRWQYGLGVESQALHLDDLATATLLRASRSMPEYPTTWIRLGQLALEAGELDAARAYYRQYCQRVEDLAPGCVGLGRVALARGDTTRAEEHFREAVRRSPGDFLAHRFLGRVFAVNGKPDLARTEQALAERLDQYSGWLTFDPWLAESHEIANTQRYLTNQMRLAVGAGDYDAFVTHGEALLRRRPGDYGTLGNLAAIYREIGRLDKAQACVDAALALKPLNPAVLCIQAEIAFTRTDYEAALRALDAAAAIDPSFPKVFELRGRTFFLQGRPADAIAAVRQSIEFDPSATTTRALLAVMLQQSGELQEAVAIADDLVRRNPLDQRATSLLESIRAQIETRAGESR